MSEPSTELLPCPFCGGKLLHGYERGAHISEIYLTCGTCGAGANKTSWNDRANRWSAFDAEDLDEIMDYLPDNDLSQEIEAEITRRAAAKQERCECDE